MDSKDCAEAKQAIDDLEKAQTRVNELFQRLMGGSPLGGGVREAGAGPGRGKRRGRGAARRGGRRARVRATAEGPSTQERVTYHPSEIVQCALCGAKVGTRRDGVTPYPYRHEGADGRPCKGSKQPAKLITD